MKTLLELVSAMERLGDREAVVRNDGLRTHRSSYRELLRLVSGVGRVLDAHGVGKGDRILLWGENRREWVAIFWAGILRGAPLVPVDFRSSPAFVARVAARTKPKLVAHGASVALETAALGVPALSFADIVASEEAIVPARVEPDDVFQVLFTSGTTGEPKGVVHRHRHLVPTLDAIAREFTRYERYARPFQPIRFLDLLPLSHVFGQFAGLFLPVVIGGAVVFMKEIHPAAIMETTRRERVSVLISVPRFLSSLRGELARRFTSVSKASDLPSGLAGALFRWWRHRDVHRAFGLKFWAVLSGGARLPLEEETFWSRLGFVVVQGYGLTETTSFVSTNHPFRPKRGSLGKTLGPQEVKLAPDGEILVRGANVSHELYGEDSPPSSEGEWLATGDLGEIGPDETLYYKGRKKDVIVLAEGMNVYPVDVEAALARQPEIKEAVVVGRPAEGGDVVHAVLLLTDREADANDAVARANESLEAHQRIREHTVWPEEDFPRTPSTFKVKRNEVMAAIGARAPAEPDERPSSAASGLVARLAGARGSISDRERLSEDLGLTSLDRIELLSELEEAYGIALSETTMAEVSTVGDLEKLVHEGAKEPAPATRKRSPLSGVVRVARTWPARLFRLAFREAVILPLFRHYIPLQVTGSVAALEGPAIFAPNHTSNLDTLALLAALPRHRRDRLAPAASQEYFRPYLDATGSFSQRLRLGFQFWLGAFALDLFPLPQTAGGVKDALAFAGQLVDEGYSILIFPEGRRTPDGKQHPFFPGVGLLAVRLQIPVVPVRLEGLYDVLPVHETWPEPGPAELRFGAPLRFSETEDYREATRRIEDAVTALALAQGQGQAQAQAQRQGQAQAQGQGQAQRNRVAGSPKKL